MRKMENENKINYLIFGLPATGKSTFIEELGKEYIFTYLGIDNMWEQSFKNPKYTFEESKIVFNNLILRINDLADQNNILVIEGVFASIERVIEIEKIFQNKMLPIRKILLSASLNTIQKRIIFRNKNKDVTLEQVKMLKEKFTSNTEADYIIDTDIVMVSEFIKIIKDGFKY
jgi:adenylate kinase family enzyme